MLNKYLEYLCKKTFLEKRIPEDHFKQNGDRLTNYKMESDLRLPPHTGARAENKES